MREILFRGKRIDNGEWEYGGCVFTENKVCLIYNQTHSIDLQGCTVEENSVGQYTGLTDKNGKKIFENDICRYDNGEEFKDKDRFSNYVVQWDSVNTRYVVVDEWNCEDILDDFFSRHAVVIGNIHDTPELLEGKS